MTLMDDHAALVAAPIIAELRKRRFEEWPESRWAHFVEHRALASAGVYESVTSEEDKPTFAAKVAALVRKASPPDEAD